MTKVLPTRISVEDVLAIWERNVHQLNQVDRKAFMKHKDALQLTHYPKFQIERAIRIGKVKYLKDIVQYLKVTEMPRAPKKAAQQRPIIESLRDFERIIPTEVPSYYICSLWQVHSYGQSCVCGRDE